MDFRLSPHQRAFRDEVRGFLAQEVTEPLRAEARRLNIPGPATAAFRDKLIERGWLGLSWPREYGGLGRPYLEQYILAEELEYAEAPPLPLAITSIGPTLMKVGSDEQKRELLPGVVTGHVDFALGYSEVDAGSDLAAIETRAVPEGNGFRIEGHKVFTSIAHLASHIWLAARTNPDAPRHRGISIFLVPVESPGVTVRPIWTVGEGRLNEVFFDSVAVPRTSLVGEVDRGWYYMMMALDFERGSLAPYSLLLKLHEDLVRLVRSKSADVPAWACQRSRHLLADSAIEVSVARLLAMRTALIVDKGQVPQHEAHIQKVFRSEALRRIASAGLRILGLPGQFSEGDPRAEYFGKYVRHVELGIRTTIGAGTNEVLRSSIATRGLGLPR